MIQVQVNGESRTVDAAMTLAEALTEWGYVCEKIAVAINGEFVARGDYEKAKLSANDVLDVVAPVQGG